MVKTTIILEDQLYRQLVNEAVETYGSTRKLSLLINKKLMAALSIRKKGNAKILTIRLGKKAWRKGARRSPRERTKRGHKMDCMIDTNALVYEMLEDLNCTTEPPPH